MTKKKYFGLIEIKCRNIKLLVARAYFLNTLMKLVTVHTLIATNMTHSLLVTFQRKNINTDTVLLC